MTMRGGISGGFMNDGKMLKFFTERINKWFLSLSFEAISIVSILYFFLLSFLIVTK